VYECDECDAEDRQNSKLTPTETWHLSFGAQATENWPSLTTACSLKISFMSFVFHLSRCKSLGFHWPRPIWFMHDPSLDRRSLLSRPDWAATIECRRKMGLTAEHGLCKDQPSPLPKPMFSTSTHRTRNQRYSPSLDRSQNSCQIKR
jgi:hypothetical protein